MDILNKTDEYNSENYTLQPIDDEHHRFFFILTSLLLSIPGGLPFRFLLGFLRWKSLRPLSDVKQGRIFYTQLILLDVLLQDPQNVGNHLFYYY